MKYIWLKGEPKFGTNILNATEAMQENILTTKEVSASRMETDCDETNLKIRHDKAKKQKKAV